MAFTQLQARDQYIIDSVAQFLVRNVQTAYNAEMPSYTTSLLDISKSLKIMQGKPSDASIALDPPAIGIDDLNGPAPDFDEIGSNQGWRCKNILLCCYPAINAVDGQPNDQAAYILKSYMQNVLSTVSFKILDYSNPSFNSGNILYCNDNAYITRFTTPQNRGKSSPNAAERNRFDMSLQIKYSVGELIIS